MSALSVYYATLKKMAEEGNTEAKLALHIGESVGEASTADMTRSVCNTLTQADEELGEALSHNDVKWTKATDRAIERARSGIAQALSIMAQR